MSRPIGALLKEHAVLAAGIALPVLLILLFAIARAVPSSTVPDPVFDAVFATQNYYGGYSFAVKDGKLEATYTAPPKDAYQPPKTEAPKIIIYRSSTGKADTITLTKPELSDNQKSAVVSVKEFDTLKLSDKAEAPDGYTFRPQGWRSNSSVVTEIFSYNSRQTPNSLEKDGRLITIDPLKDRYYGDVTFIGWVTP